MEEVKPKKIDRRVIKTKKAIRNAFIQLLTQKDLEKITIKDIADTADVNRKTIYNYYSSREEILEDIEKDIISSYEEVLNELDLGSNYESAYKAFTAINNIFKEDLSIYSDIMTMTKNSGLTKLLINYFIKRLKETFLQQNALSNPENAEVIATFVVSGLISSYICWNHLNSQTSLEDFSKMMHVLVTTGTNSFLN